MYLSLVCLFFSTFLNLSQSLLPSAELAHLTHEKILRDGLPHANIPPLRLRSRDIGMPSGENVTHVHSPHIEYQWTGDVVRQRFVSPTGERPRVVLDYAPGEHNWDAGRRGVDLAVAKDSPVFASAAGRVIYAGMLVDRMVISIEHEGGLRTTYEPVDPIVSVGTTVTQGQQIGTVLTRSCPGGNCLHWGAKYGSKDYINPMLLLNGRIRLMR
ncbi:M23 family metallopeptidase [Arcanobacterium canis]